MIAEIFGTKARFCDRVCRDSFQCDREHGLIYGSWESPSGDGIISWEEGSIVYEVCAYCRRDLSDGPSTED